LDVKIKIFQLRIRGLFFIVVMTIVVSLISTSHFLFGNSSPPILLKVHGNGDDNSDDKSQKSESLDFTFVAAGDFGCGEEAKKTVATMATKKPELVFALGDLADKKIPDCWFNMISSIDNNSRFKISFGWDEVSGKYDKYNQYLKHFNLSKPYYSFDYKNIHFLAMATPKNRIIPYDETSEQYQFIKKDLIKAHNNRNIDWIIVYSYRSFYSSNTTHPGLDEIQEAYHPLFDKYHVDVVLQAHNHNYQRTYPISYNYTRQFTPVIMDRNTESYSNIEKGQIFFTVGTGGADLYNFTGQAPYVVEQFLRHGFLNVDVTDKGSKLSVQFFDNTGLAHDHITISKKTKHDIS
jgi:hypothetical protein